MSTKVSVVQIKAAARGSWGTICRELAPALAEAIEKRGRHVSCPVHGGEDGFRLFPDFDESGGGICNTCGTFSDGIALISWVNGWSFSTTIENSARTLGLQTPSSRALGPLEPVKHRRYLYGRISACGKAPFRFKEGARESFRIELTAYSASDDFASGRSEVLWGIDLERALSDAKAEEGDWIEVSRLGMQEISTPSGERLQRALWHVRKVEPLDERRARITAEMKATREADLVKAQRITSGWKHAFAIRERDNDSAAATTYLRRRGIFLGEGNLTKGDGLRAGLEQPFYEEGRLVGRFPTLIAAIRSPDGEIVTLHQTVLTPEGFKAPLKAPKRIMPLPSDRTIKGGAIRLGTPIKILAVAEGIETALSVTKALRLPCWATVSANGMESFVPPSQVKTLLIFADRDRSETGAKAAEKLKARMERSGIYCEIHLPEENIPEDAKGVDWNDVLTRGGVEAVRREFETGRPKL